MDKEKVITVQNEIRNLVNDVQMLCTEHNVEEELIKPIKEKLYKLSNDLDDAIQ